MDHLALIEGRIALLKKEIAELETARDVLLRLATEEAGQNPGAKPKRKPKTADGARAKKQGRRTSMKERVLEVLRKSPMKSPMIIETVGAGTKAEKQQVYSALNDLLTSNQVAKADDRTYSVPVDEPAAAPN